MSQIAENPRFASIDELTKAHSELLREHNSAPSAGIIAKIRTCVERLKLTGAILESPADRRAAQTRIDYWTTILLRADDAREMALTASLLDPFDPTQIKLLTESDCPFRDPALFQEPGRQLSLPEQKERIESAARQVGLRFEDGVTEALAREVVEQPDGPAMLQFALMQLWNRRERNWIKWQTYHEFGTVLTALNHTAERVFQEQPPQDQELTRLIFLKLLKLSESGEVIPAQVSRSELHRLGKAKRVDDVLSRFTRVLLVRDGDPVELGQTALIRQWSRLAQWLEQSTRLRVASAARLWKDKDHDPGLLLAGKLIDEARQFDDLSELETKFLNASRDQETSRLRQEGLMLRILVGALIVLTLVAYYAYRTNQQLVQAQRGITSLESPRTDWDVPLYARSSPGSGGGDYYYFALDTKGFPPIRSITYRVEFKNSGKPLFLFTTKEPLPDGTRPFEGYYGGREKPYVIKASMEFESDSTAPVRANCRIPKLWP